MTSTVPSPGRLQYQRQRDIYGLALKHGSVDVSALAKQFNVTTETIRRDLSELQDRLLLRRVHGGAVPYERRDHEPMVDAREMLNADEKLRIGREATAAGARNTARSSSTRVRPVSASPRCSPAIATST